MRILEVGCGSGGISHYFGTHPSGRYEVHAVDVNDSRVVSEGYDFRLLTDAGLPYPDAHFDVVISNHITEYVGDESAQLHRPREFRRVLNPAGIGYLAVPNRWILVEPHYRLAFLSWLPPGIRTGYLRRMRGASFCDCKSLEMGTVEEMMIASGFEFQNLCVEAIWAMFDIEGKQRLLRRMFAVLPDRVIAWMSPVSPTLIYRIESV